MDPGTTHRDSQELPLGHIEEWEALAVDYLDGSAPDGGARAIEAHVGQCAPCRAELESQRRVAGLLRDLEPLTPPAYLEAAVLDRVAPRVGPGRPVAAAPAGLVRRLLDGMTRRPWLPAAIAVVVVAVSLASATDLFRSTSTDDNPAALSASQTAPEAQGSSALPDEKSATGGSGGVATTTAAAGATQETVASGSDTTVSALSEGPGVADTATTAVPDLSPTTAPPMAGVTRSLGLTVLWALYGGDAAGDPTASGQLVEDATGLQPLPASMALGGPTFAARVSRADVERELQLVRETGLTLTLTDTPPSSESDAAARITEADPTTYPMLAGTPQGDAAPAGDSSAAPSVSDEVLLVLAPYVR